MSQNEQHAIDYIDLAFRQRAVGNWDSAEFWSDVAHRYAELVEQEHEGGVQ